MYEIFGKSEKPKSEKSKISFVQWLRKSEKNESFSHVFFFFQNTVNIATNCIHKFLIPNVMDGLAHLLRIVNKNA